MKKKDKSKRIFARLQARQLKQVAGGMKCGGGGHVATESWSGSGDGSLVCGMPGTMDDSDWQ